MTKPECPASAHELSREALTISINRESQPVGADLRAARVRSHSSLITIQGHAY